MKRCLNCDKTFDSADWTCPACGQSPGSIDGITAFSLDALGEEEQFFDQGAFDILPDVEENSFWFQNRQRVIEWALATYFPRAESFLEIGCGTGFVLAGIHKAKPHLRVAGGEIYPGGLKQARHRLPEASLYQMDARNLPFEHEFDVIGSFDVLEHIDDDEAVLESMRRALRPRGGVLISVPQHRWLWSAADDYNCHKRRYLRRELSAKLQNAGFELERVTSFVSFLLPLMVGSRMLQKNAAQHDPSKEHARGNRLQSILDPVLRAETALIRRGMNFPAGGSLLAVASRR